MGLRDRAIVLTLILTGRRRAEVLGLKASDVSHDGRAFYSYRGKGYRGKGGKTGKRELPQPAFEAIELWLECTGKSLATMAHDDSLWPDTRTGRGISSGTTYTYGDADEMLTAGGVSYDYDVRGNQTERGSDTFEWDHENRMTELTIGSTTATYTYNGDGVRMSSTVGSNTTNYVWDVAAGLPVILQDGTNTYVYGLGLISTYDGTDMTYRVTDGLGSTINLCDQDGNVLVTHKYDAFGGIRSQSGTSSNPFKFTGEQRDEESGYDYLRARYYDSLVGRFIGADPAGQGSNSYSYALNNPANLADPSGLWTICNQWVTVNGQFGCGQSQEVTVVHASQVVYDVTDGTWGPPQYVDDWKDGDWVCNGVCVSQIDLLPDGPEAELRAAGYSDALYDWYVASASGSGLNERPHEILAICDTVSF